MATVLGSMEQKVVLHNVSWATYERLLAERGEDAVPRFSFDQGVLEIMSPSAEHEEYKCTIAQIVDVVAEELGINIRRLGSATFKRQDVDRGFEPDACFYIQSVDLVRGKHRLDAVTDPPPDLVIEVDITSDSIKKQGIFAALQVPELWRYDGSRLTILRLETRSYTESRSSVALPLLTATDLTDFIAESRSIDSVAWLRKLRAWVREHATKA